MRVDLVAISHVGVLRAALLEGLGAVEDGAGERLLTRVRANVVVQRARRLAPPAAVLTDVRALAWSIVLGQGAKLLLLILVELLLLILLLVHLTALDAVLLA